MNVQFNTCCKAILRVHVIDQVSFALYSSSSSSSESETDDSSSSSSASSDQGTNGKKLTKKHEKESEISTLFLRVTGLANRPGKQLWRQTLYVINM